MMDDKFLYQFQKHPPIEFSEMLFERISTKKDFSNQNTLLRGISWAMVILFVTMAFLFVFSPTARAQIEEVIKQIGEMVFYEVEQIPPLPSDYNKIASPIAGNSLPLEDIRSQIPFDLAIPAWLPDDFEFVNAVLYEPCMSDDRTCDNTQWSVVVFWQNNTHGVGTMLTLFATYSDAQEFHINDPNAEISPNMIIGLDSVEEIEINGLPAAIIHGNWLMNYNCFPCDRPDSLPTQTPSWYDNGLLTLMWIDDGVRYQLIPDDTFYVSTEELIHIAESMR